MALKRPGSTPTMESSSNSHPNNSNNYPEEEENQRSNRRRKLTHSRVRFSEEVPTVHPRMEQREGEGLQQQQHPTREEIVKLWYSRKEVQQFLVERSNLAILLLNLNGNVPLEEDESRGFCLRGFEQYFSTAVRQQILARRIEHRTMVLMEQYRQVCDLGRRDPSLLRACIQHISQPAIDEALVLAALDTRAISDDLATCRLYFPLCQQAAFGYRNNGFSTTTATSPTTATTTLHATLPSTEYTANYNSIDSLVYQRPSVTPSTSFLETSKDRQVSGNDHKNQQWTTRTTTTKQQRTNRKANKLAPLKSSSVLMANPVVIPLPPQQNPEPALSSLSLRFFIE